MAYGVSNTLAGIICQAVIAEYDKDPIIQFNAFLSIRDGNNDEIVRVVFGDTAFSYETFDFEDEYAYATLNATDAGVVHSTGNAVSADFVVNYDPEVLIYSPDGVYLRFEVGTSEASPIRMSSTLLTDGEKVSINALSLRIKYDYLI